MVGSVAFDKQTVFYFFTFVAFMVHTQDSHTQTVLSTYTFFCGIFVNLWSSQIHLKTGFFLDMGHLITIVS